VPPRLYARGLEWHPPWRFRWCGTLCQQPVGWRTRAQCTRCGTLRSSRRCERVSNDGVIRCRALFEGRLGQATPDQNVRDLGSTHSPYARASRELRIEIYSHRSETRVTRRDSQSSKRGCIAARVRQRYGAGQRGSAPSEPLGRVHSQGHVRRALGARVYSSVLPRADHAGCPVSTRRSVVRKAPRARDCGRTERRASSSGSGEECAQALRARPHEN